MRGLKLVALFLVLVPSGALAQAARPVVPPAAPPAAAAAPQTATPFTTASGLASACEQPAAAGRNFCLGVLFGLLSMYNVIADLVYEGRAVLSVGGRVVCPPDDVNFNDLRDEFPKWMKRNVEAKDLAAPRALFFMLGELYPCENSPLLPKRE